MARRFGYRTGDLIADGRYEVITPISNGSFGEVYHVKDLVLGDDAVALKALFLRWKLDDDIVRRFQEEFKISRRLTHSGIPRAYDLIRDQKDNLYITMEFVHGKTLKQTIADGKLSFTDKLFILFQLADILSYTHKQGVIHRDIKSENVLVGENCKVTLTDFGIARSLSSSANITKTSDTLGSALYMSPELFKDAKRVDHRTDIFALGMLGYELVDGEPPYGGLPPMTIAYKTWNERTPSLRTKHPEVPLWYDEFVQRATERDREQRHQSADELKELFATALFEANSTYGHGELLRMQQQYATRAKVDYTHMAKMAAAVGLSAAALSMTGFPWLW
jgi:serine/threonine-protein kinase